MPFTLPSLDSTSSPLTGWTRRHWESTADRWLSYVRNAVPESSVPGAAAMPVLPGRVTRDGVARESMETIGRSFLLAAARIAGAQGQDPEGWDGFYAEALLAGTEQDKPWSWPLGVTCRSPLMGVTNSIVEAANIAFGLHISQPWLWDKFDRNQQQQIAKWLLHHARCDVWNNNWQLFPSMAEGFLRSVGEDTSGCTGDRNVARVQSWYLGEGWYTDGPEHAIDYYNSWAIHPFLWAWHRMTGQESSAPGQDQLERLRLHVESLSRFVAADGSVMHFGRSLPYRHAMLAPLWCARMSGVSPLSAGATRRLASGVLAKFTAADVGIEGPPNLGWYREFLPASQAYSGFGSPYLAGMGFLGLALSPEDEVWTAVEEAQPSETGPAATTIRGAGIILTDTPGGIVRLINHGSDHCGLPVSGGADPDDPHYAKFGYSTHTAPGLAEAWNDGVDGHLALVDPSGYASRRGPIRGCRTEEGIAGSAHIPQRDGKALQGCSVVTVSAVHEGLELRAHLVTAPAGYSIREGAAALAGDAPVEHGRQSGMVWARNVEGIVSAIVPLHGWEGDSGIVEHRESSVLGDHSATPWLSQESTGTNHLLVALHVLDRMPAPDTAQRRVWEDAASVMVNGTVLTIQWTNGPAHRINLASWVPWDGQLSA